MQGSLVLLTGASGSGKTTLARAVQQTYPGTCEVLFFDSVGVPSPESMKVWGDGHQPGGAWMRAMTLQWIARIVPILHSGRSVLFEGQMRIAFVHEALQAARLQNAHILLIDCDTATRSRRLIVDRRQPDLANRQTMNWADYLRTEAIAAQYEILDTAQRSFDECVAHIHSYLADIIQP
jgi:chloramphenicol 3-O-phosphotransferase